MCKDGDNVSQDSVKHSSVSDNVQKPKKNPVPKGLTPFTSITAKQAQEASARARSLRKAMRAQLLDSAINDAKVGELFVKAFKTRDLELMKLVETGMKLVGLTHDECEEAAAQKIDLKSDNKVDGKVEISVTGLNG